MNEYSKDLEAILRQEWLSSAIWIALLCAVIVIIWISNYVYYKNQKKKAPHKYHDKKQIKKRCRAIWAAVALSVIAVAAGFLVCSEPLSIQPQIRKDIDESSYTMYSGHFYVDTYSYNRVYDKWVGVELGNGEWTFIYMNDVFESILTDRGDLYGTVIYAKNSKIVVDIKLNEK